MWGRGTEREWPQGYRFTPVMCPPAGAGHREQARGLRAQVRARRLVSICPGTCGPLVSSGSAQSLDLGGCGLAQEERATGPPHPLGLTLWGGVSSWQSGPDRGAGPGGNGQGAHQGPG